MTTLMAEPRAAQDEAEIRALLASVAAAHRERDAAAIATGYTPDAVIYDLAPPLAHRGMDPIEIQGWLDTKEGPVEVETPAFELTIDGDLAFGHGFSRMAATEKATGEPFALWFRRTVGLKRERGAWRIVHEHASVPFLMDGSFLAALDLEP